MGNLNMPECPKCGKFCRSEGGLSNHLNSCSGAARAGRAWVEQKNNRVNNSGKWW